MAGFYGTSYIVHLLELDTKIHLRAKNATFLYMIHCAWNPSIYFDKQLSNIKYRGAQANVVLMSHLININVSLSFNRVGILGIFGNLLTLLVLNRSKGTNFNQLLGFLSIIDMLLIICFILMSACTTGKTIKCLVRNQGADLGSWMEA